MTTIRLVIEYDGTRYAGWQIQPNGLAIQQVIEECLARLLGCEVRVQSSGRTDAGVHARGMVASFLSPRQLPLKAYREGLNALLPPDIAVREASLEPAGFHPRFDARGKWYRYSLYLAPVRSPLHARFSWHLRACLDEDRMADAARVLVGEHDFAAFRTAGCNARTTVREIYSLELVREGDLLHFDVRGSGFLRNMVRVMVGTLVEVGMGKRDPSDLPALLQSPATGHAGRTAPPQGLCLMKVWYLDGAARAAGSDLGESPP